MICTPHQILFTSSNLRGMRWAGYVAGIGKKVSIKLSIWKPEGTRPLGRPRHKWKKTK
jgi:hypothetical protein